MRVATPKESHTFSGGTLLYVRVTLTDDASAEEVHIALKQDATLERNGQFVCCVTTWDTGGVIARPTAQGIRDRVKDTVDEFLNDWLSVNPKK